VDNVRVGRRRLGLIERFLSSSEDVDGLGAVGRHGMGHHLPQTCTATGNDDDEVIGVEERLRAVRGGHDDAVPALQMQMM